MVKGLKISLLVAFLFISVCFMGKAVSAETTIQASVYTRPSSEEEHNQYGTNSYRNEGSNIFLKNQPLYFELSCAEGMEVIDSAALYLRKKEVASWDEENKNYAWISEEQILTDWGKYTYEWKGMLTTGEAFHVSDTIYIEYVHSKYDCTSYDYRDGVYVFPGTSVKISADVLKDSSESSERNYQYQWYYSNSENGEKKIKIEGAVFQSYSIVDTATYKKRYYFCKVTDGYNEAFGEVIKVFSISQKMSFKVIDNGGWMKTHIKGIRMKDGNFLEGAVYESTPGLKIKISTTPYSVQRKMILYAAKSKNAKKWERVAEGWINSDNDRTWSSLYLDRWNFQKGDKVYFKMVSILEDEGLSYREKQQIGDIVSYKIPVVLDKPQMFIYLNRKKKLPYFVFRADGTYLETQYRYKKTDSWKNIPKLCGKATPIKTLSLKAVQNFYVRCRTWQKIKGKKVYSEWSDEKMVKVVS